MKELTLRDVFDILPERKKESNKGDYGTLTAIVGCDRYRGAAVLCAMGALRTGVGILRIASTAPVVQTVAASVPEAIFMPVGDISDINVTELPRSTALLCGCGLGREGNTKKTVKEIVHGCHLPLILDADGLNNIGIADLEARSADTVITPHIGEFSRLCGMSVERIRADAARICRIFADRYNVTLVLKDHYTLITSPGRDIVVSRFGNQGLARGGSGDVLAGMIASFAAQGLSGYEAAVCGTVLHGASADNCARRMSMQTMLPHDILTDLGEIFKERDR